MRNIAFWLSFGVAALTPRAPATAQQALPGISTPSGNELLAGDARASVTIETNDADGIINPGQEVYVYVIVRWSPHRQFAGLRGDTLVTGNLGHSSDLFSPLRNHLSPEAWVRLGTPSGGSVVGTDIAVVPTFFTASPIVASFQSSGMILVEFTWTAPTLASPQTVDWTFVPDPVAPRARFYRTLARPDWIEANTTYNTTTLYVLPAPSSFLPIAALGLLMSRRRR